jgi:hypothetical protein
LSADWRGLARQAGYVVARDDSVAVRFEGGGSQTLYCELSPDGRALRAWSPIAKPAVVSEAAGLESPLRYAWERNRLSDLVGFTIDWRGRLIGETWVPLEGLTVEEISFYFTEVARVCDWHEFRLAGEDVY